MPVARLTVLFLVLLTSAGSAAAQTSATWTATGNNTWSTPANWSGGIPDGGGTATFNNLTGQLGNFTATIDTTSRTLGGITYDTGFSVTIAGSGGATLNIAAGGLTLNAVNSLNSSPALLFSGANSISAVIAGSGDLIKTGQGSVALTNTTNTFTGTVRVNQGTLWAHGGNGSLGNVANGIVLDGGTLGVNTNNLTANRTLTINPGGGTIQTLVQTTFGATSVVTGSGTLIKQVGNGNLFLDGDMTGFTGGLRSDAGFIVLRGTALGGSAAVDIAGAIEVHNTTTNVINRLNGRPITARGGSLLLVGNAAAASSETTGQLTLAQGTNLVTVVPNAAQESTLTFPSLTRQNNAVVYFRGNNLGAAPAANVGTIVFNASPGTLVGGGGDPNTSTTASILPFAIGNTVTGAVVHDATFVTWDSGTGRMVPVNVATGYATDILTAGTQDNVNQNASATLTGPTTINSLRMAPGASITVGGTSQLTITSGAILQTSSAATPPAVTISAPVTAGSRELVVLSTSGNGAATPASGLFLTGTISGTGGLTVGGGGLVVVAGQPVGGVTITGANTYTGPTTFNGGTVVLGGSALTVTADGSAPSVLGQGTGAITMNGSGGANRVWAAGPLVINRPLNAVLGGASLLGIGTAGLGSGESVTINGNVSLTNPTGSTTNNFLNLEGGDTRPEAVTINGVVSGNGGLRGFFGGYSILNGANTFTGGVVMGNSGFATGTGVTTQVVNETWEAGSDTAFGTGTLFVHAVSAVAPNTAFTTPATLVAGGGPRTLANKVVLVTGFLNTGGTNPITLSGPVELNGGAQNISAITVGATAPLTISGEVARGGLIKNGPGTLTLSNAANQYSGQTIVRQGVLSVGTIGNGGVAGNLGRGLTAANYLILAGNAIGDTGTLRYTGAGESTNRLFGLIGTGGTLDASGSGPLVLSAAGTATMFNPLANMTVNIALGAGAIAVSTATAAQLVVGSSLSGTGIAAGTTITEVGINYVRLSAPTTAAGTGVMVTVTNPAALTGRTLTLTGTNTGANTITPILANSAGGMALAVAKTGAGTWVLAGNNTYSGGTTVTAGTLMVNGQAAPNSGTGTGPVAINAGSFGGTGRAAGAVALNPGGTLFGGNGATATNTLTLGGGLTLDGANTIRTVVGDTVTNGVANPTASLVQLGSTTLARNTGGAGTDVTTITLVNDGTLESGLTYTVTIAAYGNTTDLTAANFAIGTPVGFDFSGTPLLEFDIGMAGSVRVVFVPVPVPEPTTVLGIAAAGLMAVYARRRRRTP